MGGKRVLVAMSGGVDSSVAAALLHEQGYEVIGATMKLFCHGEDLPDRPCCSLDSVNDARRVCQQLGVPHYVLNLESAFSRDVVHDFVGEYSRGRTPIPCVRCNTFTKFRDLVRKADALECDWIATGHYARVIDGELHRGRDLSKDQTYFLWGIERAVVHRLLLPVGDQTKTETRAMAHRLGLEVIAEKTESQDICFVPDGDHVKVIRRELGDDAPALQHGPFVLEDGTPVGMHDGFARYTIGQRKGVPGGFAAPMFVVAIDPDSRAVVLGPRESLLGRGLIARGVHWMCDTPRTIGHRVLVQHRHRATPVPAEIVRVDGDELELALDAPLSAITPGQSMVLYDGDIVLGGGFIESGRPVARRASLPVMAGAVVMALAAFAAQPIRAQRLNDLSAGTMVRLETRDGNVFYGPLLNVDADTVRLQSRRHVAVPLPVAAVQRYDIGAGPNRGRGAWNGFRLGVGIGLITLGVMKGVGNKSTFGDLLKFGYGVATVSTIAGTAIGAANPPERWRAPRP